MAEQQRFGRTDTVVVVTASREDVRNHHHAQPGDARRALPGGAAGRQHALGRCRARWACSVPSLAPTCRPISSDVANLSSVRWHPRLSGHAAAPREPAASALLT